VILGTYLGLFGWLGTGGQIRRLGVEDVSIVGGDYVGGLVGYNDGAISYCYSTGFVSGDQYVGGLVGFGGIGTILICYSAASVSGSFCVGGLVGHTNGGNISNCYSTGFVSGDEARSAGQVIVSAGWWDIMAVWPPLPLSRTAIRTARSAVMTMSVVLWDLTITLAASASAIQPDASAEGIMSVAWWDTSMLALPQAPSGM
jgi:hypothetical protein